MFYYAVKIGKNPGIYKTWDECKKEVIGFKGSVYKKFSNLEDAENFINNESRLINGNKDLKINEDEFIAYVDGSYRNNDKSFSYGVYIFNKREDYSFSKRFYKEDSSMRNVLGEIRGAIKAMDFALEKGKKKLYLYYDYEGIAAWPLENWTANKKATISYRDYYKKIKDKLEVVFIKVKSHSGVKYNELVDKLAKEAKWENRGMNILWKLHSSLLKDQLVTGLLWAVYL